MLAEIWLSDKVHICAIILLTFASCNTNSFILITVLLYHHTLPTHEMCLTVRHISAGFCIGNPFSVLDLQNALSGGGILGIHR